MKTVKELLELRAEAHAQMADIVQTAEKESREMTNEEFERFLKFEGDVKGFTEQKEKRERINAFKSQIAEKRAESEDKAEFAKKTTKEVDPAEQYRSAFWNYARYGGGGLNTEERMALSSKMREVRGTDPQTTTVARGGYTIPEGFSNELVVSMAYFGGILEAARSYVTETGNSIPWPTVDDTSVSGAILNEDSPAVTVSDMTFGQKVLDAYTYHSNIVKVSIPLVEDSAFNLEEYLMQAFAERLGRITNQHCTTGTGTGQPNGFVTAINAASGTVNAANDDVVSRTDLINLVHGVNRSYRVGPKVGFMFNDTTLAAIKALAFGTGDARPLWVPSMREGEPDTLEGFQYWINNNMADIAADARPIAFGDFSKYVIRRVNGMQFIRLDERFADQLQVGFIAYMRLDGELLDTAAIKLLRNTNT